MNNWTGKGWQFDSMQFAMRESSKRPSMAFVLFTKEEGQTPAHLRTIEAPYASRI